MNATKQEARPKRCLKCGQEKPATRDFFPEGRKTTTSGEVRVYLHSPCRDCRRVDALQALRSTKAADPERVKKWAETYKKSAHGKAAKNRAARDLRARRAGFADHADRVRHREETATRKAAMAALAGAIKRLAVSRRPPRPPWSAPGLTDAESYRIRYRLDPEFAVAERMRRQVRKKLRRDGIGDMIRCALNRGGTGRTIEARLGYTIAELRRHLEALFTPGMSWARFAAGEIHIDHVRPQSWFDLTKPEEWRRCWSMSNLQPLWAADNLKKSNKPDCLRLAG